MTRARKTAAEVSAILMVLALSVWGLVHAITSQMHRSEDGVNAISDLRDPSPFRAALMGHLDKSHMGTQTYVRTRDETLPQQVTDSIAEFEKSVPEFEHQNPKLLPRSAGEDILQDFRMYKESVSHLMAISRDRTQYWKDWEKNFDRILTIIGQKMRPLIKRDQAESDERLDSILKVENQLRAWEQSMTRVWDDPSSNNQEIASENENKGELYIDSSIEMAQLKAEKKNLREIRDLWRANEDLARRIVAFGTVQAQAGDQENALRDRSRATLKRLLPAMRPEDLEAKKQAILRSMRWHLVAAALLALLGILLVAGAGLLIHRVIRGPALRPVNTALPPTLVIDGDGRISAWSGTAEQIYGYSTKEIVGQSIGKLFGSEADIEELYKQLQAKKTEFTTHQQTKHGQKIQVLIVFHAAAGKGKGIALECHRL